MYLKFKVGPCISGSGLQKLVLPQMYAYSANFWSTGKEKPWNRLILSKTVNLITPREDFRYLKTRCLRIQYDSCLQAACKACLKGFTSLCYGMVLPFRYLKTLEIMSWISQILILPIKQAIENQNNDEHHWVHKQNLFVWKLMACFTTWSPPAIA